MDLGHNFADDDFNSEDLYLRDVDYRMWIDLPRGIMIPLARTFRNGFEAFAFRVDDDLSCGFYLQHREVEFTMGAFRERLSVYTPQSSGILFTNMIANMTDATLIHYRTAILPLYNSRSLLYNSIRRMIKNEI